MSEHTRGWVIDTSVLTHFFRAGHGDLLGSLAPGGSILVPNAVREEVEVGRAKYAGIPAVSEVPWARVAILTDSEADTALQIKAALGGSDSQHLGECEVIAVAAHRGGRPLLDDRAARVQAAAHGLEPLDSLWIVIEAFVTVLGQDRESAIGVVDDLIATGMRLPFHDGRSLFAWAFEQGLLPRE